MKILIILKSAHLLIEDRNMFPVSGPNKFGEIEIEGSCYNVT